MIISMSVEIRSLVDGANEAEGLVVVIDVLRACTTIEHLFANGMTEIIPVKEPEDALPYKALGYILIGEGDHGSQHDIFDFNNSPTDVLNEDFSGKKGVLRSNNCTQAILNAEKASEIILASFLNIKAVVNYIKNHHIDQVTILALGRLGGKGIEDELCAQVIKAELEGISYDFEAIKDEIKNCPTAILVRETLERPQDVELALMLNAFDIVPRVENENGIKVIRQIK
jgi:2-phosphosulfolactate phosphatase